MSEQLNLPYRSPIHDTPFPDREKYIFLGTSEITADGTRFDCYINPVTKDYLMTSDAKYYIHKEGMYDDRFWPEIVRIYKEYWYQRELL